MSDTVNPKEKVVNSEIERLKEENETLKNNEKSLEEKYNKEKQSSESWYQSYLNVSSEFKEFKQIIKSVIILVDK